jgi:hypothetical protein
MFLCLLSTILCAINTTLIPYDVLFSTEKVPVGYGSMGNTLVSNVALNMTSYVLADFPFNDIF